jgi:hypothetical protein
MKIRKISLAVLALLLTAMLYLSSCSTLKESYKTENGITIHTIRSHGAEQAYLIVKQTKNPAQ